MSTVRESIGAGETATDMIVMTVDAARWRAALAMAAGTIVFLHRYEIAQEIRSIQALKAISITSVGIQDVTACTI